MRTLDGVLLSTTLLSMTLNGGVMFDASASLRVYSYKKKTNSFESIKRNAPKKLKNAVIVP
jgi:hypothetical protein